MGTLAGPSSGKLIRAAEVSALEGGRRSPYNALPPRGRSLAFLALFPFTFPGSVIYLHCTLCGETRHAMVTDAGVAFVRRKRVISLWSFPFFLCFFLIESSHHRSLSLIPSFTSIFYLPGVLEDLFSI